MLAIALWSIVGNGTLLCCAAIADMAMGGDFLGRWLPGSGVSLAEPWAGAPPLSRLLALGLAIVAGVSIARTRAGWWGTGVTATIVLLPWLHRASGLLSSGEPLVLQPFLPIPFWLLGIVVGSGLVIGWHKRYPVVQPAPDLPISHVRVWAITAGIGSLALLGLGEAAAGMAAHIAWNEYVDILREQERFEGCDRALEARFEHVMNRAPSLVATRVEQGCQENRSRRGGRERDTRASTPPPQRQPSDNRRSRNRRNRRTADFVASLTADPTEWDGERIVILYSVMRGGSIDRSGGGLARLSTLVHEVRATGIPTLVLDAGNLTYLGNRIEDEQRFSAGLKANAVLDSFEHIGLDAACPSRGDLVLGLDWIDMQATMRQLPYVSANLRDADGNKVFPAARVLGAGTRRIGVFGISHPSRQLETYQANHAIDEARAAVAWLEQQDVDVIIGLADMYGAHRNRNEETVFEAVEGVDFYLLSSAHTSGEPPCHEGSAIVHRTRTGDTTLASLVLEFVPGGEGFYSPSVIEQRDRDLQKQRRNLQSQQQRLDKRRQQEVRYQPSYLETQLEETRSQIQHLETLSSDPAGRNLARFERLTLSREEEDPAVVQILEECATALQERRGFDR